MVQYYKTSTSETPFIIRYTCKHCGHKNTDNNQKLLVTGSSRASFNPHRRDAEAEADASHDRNMQKIIDQINNDKYRNVHLHCRCEKCGKKPLWSTYINVKWLLLVAILGLYPFLYATLSKQTWAYIAAAALIAPFFICLIINLVIDSKVKKLDREYLPDIQVRSVTGRSPEERLHDVSLPKDSTDREPEADEWKCSKCGRINKNYIGTCGCGTNKP